MNTSLLRNWSLRHNLSTLNFQAFFFYFFKHKRASLFSSSSFIISRSFDSSRGNFLSIIFSDEPWREQYGRYIYPEGNHLPSFVSAWFRPFGVDIKFNITQLYCGNYHFTIGSVFLGLYYQVLLFSPRGVNNPKSCNNDRKKYPFLSCENDKCSFALHPECAAFHPFVINRSLCSSNSPVKLMP